MFYALETYPDKPMEQISGMTHPAGKIHYFITQELLNTFLADTPNTRQVDKQIASLLAGLNPLDSLSRR